MTSTHSATGSTHTSTSNHGQFPLARCFQNFHGLDALCARRMACLVFPVVWRSAPSHGRRPCGPSSHVGRSNSRTLHMQPDLSFTTWNASSSRLSRSKVWAQESSSTDFLNPSESFSSEADEGGSSNESIQAANQNLLLKLLILAVIVAAVFTVSTALQFQSSNTLVGTKFAEAGPHYKLRLLGRDMLIGERCPGWVYFWLLMAAGFGLFVSEEALNVWVGATLARMLTFNGLWMDLVTSISANGFYIFPTVFWVYWGVCISDMIPFYAGRFAAQSKAGDTFRKKVGVNEKKLKSILQTVQRYGNLIGFVERFSLGVRNPTSFVAGAMGVSPEKFFTGVCLGALITMPLQMGVGFVLRERPMAALAGVAAAVGTWTVLPYLAAGIASIVFIIRNQVAQQHPSTTACSKESSD